MPRDVAVAHPRAEEVERRAHDRASSSLPRVRRLRSPHDASAADAPAVERPLRGDAHGRRLGLQPLARPRRHALARGRDPRRLGQLRLPARRRQRRGLVGRLPAERRRARQLRGRRSPRTAPRFVRRDGDARHHARGRRLGRGRRRGPPRLARQRRAPSAREIELTSYAELVLAPPAADVAHPAFSKLFVADRVPRRRRRPPGDAPAARARAKPRSGPRISPSSKARRSASVEFETDRARFLGRGRDVGDAVAVIDGRPLSNTVGTVLDPIFACAAACAIAAGRRRRASPSGPSSRRRARQLLDLVDKHRDPDAFERAATLAWTQAQVQLRHLGIEPGRGAACSSASPDTSSTPIRRCAPSSDTIRRGVGGPARRCGRTASPATCRSSWCASTTSRTSTSSASCCRRTSTGA